MANMTFWRDTLDGTEYPVYRLPYDGEPLCEVEGADDDKTCMGKQWWTGVAGDLSIVLCDAHLDDQEAITEAEYDRLADEIEEQA